MARRLILLTASVLLCGPAMAGPLQCRDRLPISTPALSVSSCWPGRHFWLVAGGAADWELLRLAMNSSGLASLEKKMARQLNPTRGICLVLRSGDGGALAVPGPSPDFDTGLVGFVMLAGAAFLAHRRRRS